MTYDTIELKICQNQGCLYRFVANLGYNIEEFSNAYLASDFCKRAMDTTYSRYQLHDEQEILDFLMPEIQDKCSMLPDGELFNLDVAYWIGFTYRQLYYETDIFSKELAEKFTFSDICKTYSGLHTIDEEMATDILCENRGIKKTGRW